MIGRQSRVGDGLGPDESDGAGGDSMPPISAVGVSIGLDSDSGAGCGLAGALGVECRIGTEGDASAGTAAGMVGCRVDVVGGGPNARVAGAAAGVAVGAGAGARRPAVVATNSTVFVTRWGAVTTAYPTAVTTIMAATAATGRQAR